MFTTMTPMVKIFTFYITFIITKTAVGRRNFAVTTSLLDYHHMKHKWFVDTVDPSPEEKEEICAGIVRSPLFEHQYKVDLVNPLDKAVYTYLRKKDPKLYRELYTRQKYSSKEIIFTNPIRAAYHSVVRNRDYPHSHVFACLTANRTDLERNVIVYFVSIAHELVFHRSRQSREDRPNGHFIFAEYNEHRQVRMIALAEEPGFVIDPTDERYNASIFGCGFDVDVGAGDSEEPDVESFVCSLRENDRMRLCALVLSAKYYSGKVTFLPDKKNVDMGCQRAVMRFNNFSNVGDERERVYRMIGCKAVNAKTQEPVKYHVSVDRSYKQCFCVGPDDKAVVVGGIQRIGFGLG